MRLSILIFDSLTVLDAIGGYEVLSRIPGVEVEFVAAQRGIVAADTRRLGLLAYRDFSEVQSTDILYVPGGPGARALESDPEFIDYLRLLDSTSTWTIGICNGVTLLAIAGLLKGRQATTNWLERKRLPDYGAEFIDARYHRDGKYITGAGVSASIDTALHFAQLLVGDDIAKALQFGIEYYPAPPFPEKTPAQAPDMAQQMVRQFAANGAQALLKTEAPFARMGGAPRP